MRSGDLSLILTAAGGLLAASLLGATNPFPADSGARLAQWDIVYRYPAEKPAEGLPIGNGRMGTLVWTTLDSLVFQINRNDNFTANRLHDGNGQSPANQLPSLGSFAIHFDRRTFEGVSKFQQRLSLGDATVSLHAETRGGPLAAEAFVAEAEDVLSVRVNDQRQTRNAVAELSLWRPPELKNGSQVWRYRISDRGGKVLLLHEVMEGKFVSRYAIAVGVEGRRATIETADPQRALLRITAGTGPYRVLLATAAAMDPATDVAQRAMSALDRVMRQEYGAVVAAHKAWWRLFWNRSFVSLHSPDGTADYLKRLYDLHLYLMACSSRGAFPPKFNGSIWLTQQDQRRSGAQYTVWNTESLYYPLFAANQLELTDPYFRMYREQLPRARTAARQRWGAAGAHFPEVAPQDGPRELPENIAAEYRDVLLGRKTRNDLSAEARRLGNYDASLATLTREADQNIEKGRFTSISHILSSGSELALQFWWRWRYTHDRQWLSDHAYPVMKDCAEFYLSFAKPGEDKHVHVSSSNVHESFWGVRDSIADLAAIRGLLPQVIRASEILGVDAPLRSRWRAFLQSLAPYPLGNDPLAQQLGGGLGPGRWAAGLYAGVAGKKSNEEVWTMPVFPFEDVTADRHEEDAWKIANYTYQALPQRTTLLAGGGPELLDEMRVPENSRLPALAARLGRADEVRRILPAFLALVQRLPNGLPTMASDPALPMVDGLAMPAFALQEALVQGTDEIIHLFPAWPMDWDAQFRLRTRGGFLVTASRRKGVTEMVEIESLAGETCRLENPWSGTISLYTGEGEHTRLKGEILKFPTEPGETYLLVPRSTRVSSLKMEVAPPPEATGLELSVTFPSGQVIRTQLGK